MPPTDRDGVCARWAAFVVSTFFVADGHTTLSRLLLVTLRGVVNNMLGLH